MLFDKCIWTSVSPVRKDSTYISLEYVLNDLGIFCKGEQRTKDVGFALSRIGSPLGMTAVDGVDYAAKTLGRVALLWSEITDVREDSERDVITVFGKNGEKVIIKHEPELTGNLLSRISSMRQLCASAPSSDAVVSAWRNWATDKSIDSPFAPLDTLIENARTEIDSIAASSENPYTESAVPTARFCTACGKQAADNANFCTGCGAKLNN